MATWRLESRTRAGALQAVLPYRDLQGEFFGDKPDQIRFKVPYRNPKITQTTFWPGLHEIWGYRNDTLAFAGPLWEADLADNALSCTAEGLESYFDLRLVSADVVYNTTRDQIVWSLINTSQSMTDGSLGIIPGTINNVPTNLNVEYLEKENLVIRDIIDKMAVEGNFDWEITPGRGLNLIYPKIQSRANVALQFPGNVRHYTSQTMGKYMNNYVKTSSGDTQQLAIDTVSRAKYGLRQAYYSASDLPSVAQLTNFTNETLSLRREVKLVPQVMVNQTVNPFDTDITYGQLVRLTITDGWFTFDQDQRCNGWQVTVGKHGEETIVLYLGDLREVT